MLGTRIALLRRQAGLSQRALAAALQLSPSTVGMYEQCRRIPSSELLVRMAQLFGVSTDFLLTGQPDAGDRSAVFGTAAMLSQGLHHANGAPLTCGEAVHLMSALFSAGELTQDEKSAIMGKKGERTMTDEAMMREALALAAQAAAQGEVPVGCVITDGETIVGRGRNRREYGKNALAHAELEAIDEACRTLDGWRLWRCTLYVTLEPCPMCAGAIINARIARVVYAAADEKAGSCGSLTNLFALPYNHQPQVEGGLLADEARQQLRAFFRALRENPKVKTWKHPV